MYPRLSLSRILDDLLAAYPDDDHISLQEAIQHLGVRAYGPLLVLFALPNTIPNIPGLGSLFGLPLMFFAVQMALGRAPWLPAFLASKGVARTSLHSISDRARPWLERADRAVHPRMLWLSSPFAERVLGWAVLLLAFAIVLPLPFTNMFPAWAIAAIGIGVLDRDGAWILGGLVWGVIALAIVGSVLAGLTGAMLSVF